MNKKNVYIATGILVLVAVVFGYAALSQSTKHEVSMVKFETEADKQNKLIEEWGKKNIEYTKMQTKISNDKQDVLDRVASLIADDLSSYCGQVVSYKVQEDIRKHYDQTGKSPEPELVAQFEDNRTKECDPKDTDKVVDRKSKMFVDLDSRVFSKLKANEGNTNANGSFQ